MIKDENQNKLTNAEINQAQKYEKVVDDDLLGYFEIGLALMHIRDERLYEGRFAEYVEKRFELLSHKAYRMIRAAEVAQRLQEAGLSIPKNEGQAHRIHELINDPDEQVEFWQRVLEQKSRPTAKTIDEVAKSEQENDPPSAESHDLPNAGSHDPPVFEIYDRAVAKHGEPEETDEADEVDWEAACSIPNSTIMMLLSEAQNVLVQLEKELSDCEKPIEGLDEQLDRLEQLIEELRSKKTKFYQGV